MGETAIKGKEEGVREEDREGEVTDGARRQKRSKNIEKEEKKGDKKEEKKKKKEKKKMMKG